MADIPDYRRPAVPAAVYRAVLKRDGRRCHWCGVTGVDVDWELDHLQAWSEGGEHTVENLVMACHPCNWQRGLDLRRANRRARA